MSRYISFIQSLLQVRRLLQQPYGGSVSASQRATWTKLLLGMVVYGVLPFDLIPDFIPLIGQLDDVVIIAILMVIGGIVYLRARKRSDVIKDITPLPGKKLTPGR